jgi:Na+/melibiose symporter-like transporter
VLHGRYGRKKQYFFVPFCCRDVCTVFCTGIYVPIILYVGHGDKAQGIETVMTWLAVIGTVMLLITFFTTKERIIPKPEQKSSLKEDLKDLFQNSHGSLCYRDSIYIYYSGNERRFLCIILTIMWMRIL